MNMIDALKKEANKTYTENGARSYRSTLSGLLDLFSVGGAYRSRSDEDCINLFMKAFREDESYAMKCLFYLRDINEGAGERRFFRVVTRYLARNYPDVMRRNLQFISELGRWDDLYEFVGTPLEKDALELMRQQLVLDMKAEHPSLLAKWLKSENTSSAESRKLGEITRNYLGMTQKQYRKTLAILRERIKVVERLMSEGRWNEINFSALPSIAGFRYRNAFKRNGLTKERYEEFANDKTTTVNAGTLFLHEIVGKAMQLMGAFYQQRRHAPGLEDTERLMINKYWENAVGELWDKPLNAIVVADTSGSMYGTPLNVALSLAMYCAEKNVGPYNGNFITFSQNPTFVEIEGVDFCDKVARMEDVDWGMSTNVEAVFDLLLDTARKNHLSQNQIPEKLIIVSDMQFNACVTSNNRRRGASPDATLFENISAKWASYDYIMPQLVFWNVDARGDANFQMSTETDTCYLSGFSQNLFDMLMECKDAFDLMFTKLDDERYKDIH